MNEEERDFWLIITLLVCITIMVVTSCTTRYDYPDSPRVDDFEYPEQHGHCVVDPDNCYGDEDG